MKRGTEGRAARPDPDRAKVDHKKNGGEFKASRL